MKNAKPLTLPKKLPGHSLISGPGAVRDKLAEAIYELVLKVPTSQEKSLEASPTRARTRSLAIARAASRQASMVASSMALPPGFLGWLTVIPELIAVWKLQTQMVADIASVYGKSSTMGREQMVYCLFKHVSAQLSRDVVVRVGERFLIQRTSTAFLQALVKRLGVTVSQSLIGKSMSRFLPIVGAFGVGAYAYFDTTQVAKNAIELFSRDNLVEGMETFEG